MFHLEINVTGDSVLDDGQTELVTPIRHLSVRVDAAHTMDLAPIVEAASKVISEWEF